MMIDFSDLERQIKERGTVLTLDNGMTVVAEHVPNYDLACGVLSILPGGHVETDQNLGAMHFLEHMCFGRSKLYSDRDKRNIVAGMLGMELNASTGHSGINFQASGKRASPYLLSHNFSQSLTLVKDLVYDPVISEESLLREKDTVTREFREHEMRDRMDPYFQIKESLQHKLMSSNPKILRNGLGTLETIAGFTTEELQELHDKYFVGKNSYLGLVGDLPFKGQLRHYLEGLFGNVPEGEPCRSYQFETEKSFNGREQMVSQLGISEDPSVNMYFRIAPYESELSVENDAMSSILGEGVNSLLFRELRDKRGMVYSVNSDTSGNEVNGLMSIVYRVTPERLEESFEAVDTCIEQLKTGNFPDELVDIYKASNLPRILSAYKQPGWIKNELQHRLKKEKYGSGALPTKIVRRMVDVSKDEIVAHANKYLGENRFTSIFK